MKKNCFPKQKGIMRRVAFFWAFWQLFHRRQQDLLSNYTFNLPLHVEGPEANLASQRYWDNSLRDNFGKSLILHQNSSSSSFWKVGCYEQPETMYREFFMYCYIKNALGSFVLCMDLSEPGQICHMCFGHLALPVHLVVPIS